MAKPYSYDRRCKVMAAIAQDGMKRVKPAQSFRSVAIPSTILRPGQELVIDSATFHKGGRLESLVQAAGCEIWYLPPYSPDFNKIERCWSWLKSRIRKQLDNFDTLREAMEHVLRLAS